LTALADTGVPLNAAIRLRPVECLRL